MELLSNKNIKNNNGAVLLLSLVVTVFLSVLLGAAMLRSDVQVKEVMNRRQLQEAFYSAETGINVAIYNLREDAAWNPGQNATPAIIDEPFIVQIATTPQTIGFYSINVQDGQPYSGWQTRWITAQGKDSHNVITRTIRARVIVESPTSFLISTLGPLHIISGSQLNADALARDVFFDVDPNLPTPSNQIQINGNVHYINSTTGENNPAVIFAPNKGVHSSPSITFAGVDLNRYQTLAQNTQAQNMGYYATGDLTVDLGNLSQFNPNPPNPFNPKIIFATGNVTIVGEYSNSILIVAGKNIYINGDIKADDSLITPPQIGLFAKGDVIIPQSVSPTSDLNIEGFVLADGGIPNSQGAFIAEGEKYSKGRLNFKGAISVRGSGTTAIDLNVFQTRDYVFDANLRNNRTIPFTPFIVNLIEWQEI
jgi:hypothetical protein